LARQQHHKDGPTVLIGLDGATSTVLDPLMRDGIMPFLKTFADRGVRAPLMSTALPVTPPAFVSMMTGRSPGQHGILDFFRGKDVGNAVYFTFYDHRDIRCETVWSMASRHARRVAALNFVMTAPPPAVNGIVVPGMTHWRHLRTNTYPRSFYEELMTQPGFDRKTMCWDFKQLEQAMSTVSNDLHDWIRHHIEREKQWFKVVMYAMEQAAPELLTAVFDGVDKLQHLCWAYLDETFFPAQPTTSQSETQRLCHEYFRLLDQILEAIVDRAGPRARVFLVSDHGFGPNHVTFRLNSFLAERGHLHWRAHEPEASTNRSDLSMNLNAQIDWSKTTAYCPTQSSNGIHIRIAKRKNATGIPRERYESLRNALESDLQALTEPTTNEPLVREIHRREDIYAGPAMYGAPDLTVILRDYGFVSTARKEPIIYKNPQIRGTHYPEGIFWAAGNGIQQAHRVGARSILDVTPTLLYSLGLPVPTNLEGHVMTDVFEPPFLETRPVAAGPPAGEESATDTEAQATRDEVYSPEEKKALYEQLRALGYVE